MSYRRKDATFSLNSSNGWTILSFTFKKSCQTLLEFLQRYLNKNHRDYSTNPKPIRKLCIS